MNLVFRIVADGLNWIASVTGFTYNEINIIVYYIILPFIYVALVDRILKKHFFKIAYAIVWVVLIVFIPNFRAFSDTLFQASVDFLLFFGYVGLNYVAASVVICVILPGLVFAVLCLFAFPSLRRSLFTKHETPTSA
ncbi:hypothetical protein JIN85_19080 [Luteolibacter pohnpeiensis]|uniref:Uncharacterized protein n=1 Tax=Luteolibacter pohnpeiensis TaxID=454153 RepID=A0A934VY51_9BACT|nr:hypothetical protein [Luteolibacter pohnpeiensis]MBK1884528.1 hypothetical protein [Luteolibacter pohnpeiensis]